MLNNKGVTLIESLFAFEIFVGVLTLYTGLFITIFNHESKLNENYNVINEQETCIVIKEDFYEIAEMVLH